MLTIKHITPSGNHAIYQAVDVSYTGKNEVAGLPSQESTGSVWFRSPTTDGLLAELHDGSVYVMNDHGSTVAKYDLGGWPGPSGTGKAGAEAPAAA